MGTEKKKKIAAGPLNLVIFKKYWAIKGLKILIIEKMCSSKELTLKVIRKIYLIPAYIPL